MATTLKYNNSTIKNIIVNDNVENKQNIEIRKIEFNGKVIWVKPAKLTIKLTEYISSATLKRTNTETEDPSVVEGFEITITNPNNIPITHEDDINFYFGDTIEIESTNLSTTDNVIYRLYDTPIKLTGDTTISLEAKVGVFDIDILSSQRTDNVTRLHVYNSNNVDCHVTITIYIRLEDGSETDIAQTDFDLKSGYEEWSTIYDTAGRSNVYAEIRTEDLIYGHVSTSKTPWIIYEQ